MTVGLAQILVVGALALHEVGDCVEPKAVDAHVQPEAHDLEDSAHHLRIVEIQIRLMAEEPVPIILLGDRIERPVRTLGVDKDDACAQVFLIRIAPDIKVPFRGAGRRAARGLEPGVLVRGMIDDELCHHPESEAVRLSQHGSKIVECPVLGMNVLVVGDVVAVILEGRGVERHQPDGIDAEVADIPELRCETLKIADTVIVRIQERPDVELIDDGVLVPKRVVRFGPDGCGRDPRRRPGRRSSATSRYT